MRTYDRVAARAALRGLYLQLLAGAAGLDAYNPSDDANLDLLDGMVAGIYARQGGTTIDHVKGDTADSGATGAAGATGLPMPPAAQLPSSVPAAEPEPVAEPEPQSAFRTVDPEPAE